MSEDTKGLDTLVQEKMESDTDFQAELSALPEEEREQVVNAKKAELVEAEYKALVEKSNKNAEIAKNQEIRAKKAEALAKEQKGESTPKNDDNMPVRDILALRDVHEDDVDYLLEESKLRCKTVAELKKDPYINH